MNININMIRNSLSFFIALAFFCSTNVSAMIEVDEDDLKLSKTHALISGVSNENLDLNGNRKVTRERKGVMTICFRDVEGSMFDHAALVFEMFLPNTPNELSLRMIHYTKENAILNF